ncbi:MAG: TnpV protein [Oscillospiraceae bacterium]|nr:TnpV protein [Oscillospiraceae bacterium]
MNQIEYIRSGDYLLPNLTLPEQTGTLGKYGLTRQDYLTKHRKILYNQLLLTGQIQSHLAETDRTAVERLSLMMQELTTKNPPPDKSTNQTEWTAHMNMLKTQAEEFILDELIYS